MFITSRDFLCKYSFKIPFSIHIFTALIKPFSGSGCVCFLTSSTNKLYSSKVLQRLNTSALLFLLMFITYTINSSGTCSGFLMNASDSFRTVVSGSFTNIRVSTALLHKKQSSTCKKHACGCFLFVPCIYFVYLQKSFQYRHGWRWF